MSVYDQISELIKQEHDRLVKQKAEQTAALAQTQRDIDALQARCGHPNGIRGVNHGVPTLDCPDCGFGAYYLERVPQKLPGRRSKKRV